MCSFIPRQLGAATATPSVLFFHGLSGLENACDDGLVQKCVLPCPLMGFRKPQLAGGDASSRVSC